MAQNPRYPGFEYGPPPRPDQVGRTYDVCIIGSGAAGAVAAWQLVRAGFDVLVIEQGPYVHPANTYDEILASADRALCRDDNGTWSWSGYPWTTCNVGGGTVFYAGVSFRYREIDFDVRAHVDTDLDPAWPYEYRELAPYYHEVERLLGIAGDATGDPTAPPGPYAYLPAVGRTAGGTLLDEAGRRLGLRPFPTPLAITTGGTEHGAVCEPQAPCIEHVCPRGAKGDVFTRVLGPIAREPNFTLLAGLKVGRLVRTRREQVEAAVAHHVGGETYQFRAQVFVVACNAIQSAALLLRSGDELSPSGIGNEHDLVGRGLSMKVSEYVLGYVKRADLPPSHSAGPFSTAAFTDFYTGPQFPGGLGGVIYEARPGFALRERAGECVLRVECLAADTPLRRNRVSLAREVDADGVRRPVIDYLAHPFDEARLEALVAEAETLLREAGASRTWRQPSGWQKGSCHLHGTCRGGRDPRTSVVDADSRVHTSDNLYVVDGGFFPFPGGLNPTLTIQAHALRAANRISHRLGSRRTAVVAS